MVGYPLQTLSLPRQENKVERGYGFLVNKTTSLEQPWGWSRQLMISALQLWDCAKCAKHPDSHFVLLTKHSVRPLAHSSKLVKEHRKQV